MKFEEQLLEMQIHQVAEDKEGEERQRREGRELQLKMASMMCGRQNLTAMGNNQAMREEDLKREKELQERQTLLL